MKKYLRTKHNVFEIVEETEKFYRIAAKGNPHNSYVKYKNLPEIMRVEDSIEKACDYFITKFKESDILCIDDMGTIFSSLERGGLLLPPGSSFKEYARQSLSIFRNEIEYARLAIVTDKGLIYVANVNFEGDAELLWVKKS